MDIDISENDFAELIAEALRLDLQEQDDSYLFDFNQVNVEREILLSKDELKATIEKLRAFETPEETVISNPNSYETLVREESSFPRMRPRLRDDALAVEDHDNGLKYTLSTPSDEYILFLLLKVSLIASTRAMVAPMPLRRVFERPRDDDITSVYDVLKRIIPRFLTLRIESDKNRSTSEMVKFSSAFLFQLSYNIDVALVPQRHIEELVRTGRINRIRRVSMDELDPPRRHYIPDLIYHYQLAVGADNPFLEFISYYHVAEHFFEMIFNEDLVLRIKDKMTQPDFSYKRKKDIGALIKNISKSLQIRNETITFSEQEALRLTICKHHPK